MKFMERSVFAVLTAAITLGMVVTASAASPTSNDVPASHWAYPYVEKVVAEGLVSGVGDGKYNPSGNVTHGVRYHGRPGVPGR